MEAAIKYPELSQRIITLMSYLMISPNVLGKRTGVSNMHRIITGKITPTVSTFYKICRRYPVRIEWLMEGEGEMMKEDYFQKRFYEYTGSPKTATERVRAICEIYEITQREFCKQAKIRVAWVSEVAKSNNITPMMRKRIIDAFPAIPMSFLG